MAEMKMSTRITLPTGAEIDCSGASTDVVKAMIMFYRTQSQLEDMPLSLCSSSLKAAECIVTTHDKKGETLASMLEHINNGVLDFKVGDSFSCSLKSGQRVTFIATDVTEDAIRFEMKELLECMPRTEIRDWYEKLFKQLPDELQAAIIPTERRYRVKGNGEEIESYTSKLFTPSASEVFSKAEYDNDKWLGDRGVYEQLDYYKDASNRIRCTVENGLTNAWWLLSARSGASTGFARVNNDGSASYNSAANAWVAAPVCFRIRKSL